MTLRRATREDIPALSRFSQHIFIECFGHLYTRDNLDFFLREKHSEAYYEKVVGAPEVEIWLLEEEGALLGYIKYGYVEVPVEFGPEDAEIHRIYIAAGKRGSGAGRALMEHAMDAMREQGKKTVYLGVWSENIAAQRFYSSLGFEKCGEYLFYIGTHADDEWIMKREL